MKLHRQLVLLVLAAILPLVALSAALGAAALSQGQTEMQRDAVSRVSIVATSVQRELDAQIEVLETLSHSPLLDGPLDEARFKLYAQRLLGQQKLWMAVTLIGPDGERLMDVPELPSRVSRHVVDQATFDQVLRTKAPRIGRILRPPMRIPPVFAIFAPVVRDGRVKYVVSAVIEPLRVRATLSQNPLPRGWLSALVDQHGRFIARSLHGDALAGSPGSPTLQAAVRRGGDGSYKGVSLEGRPIITFYQTLPESGWSVHVAIPREVYAAPSQRALLLVGGGGALSFLLVAMFLALLSREIRLRQRQSTALEEGRRLEALGRMTGGVAHDFNNILMVVQGSAELLKRRLVGDDRAERLADAIVAGAQRGQTLTRQLLAFGRKSSHRPEDFRLQDRIDQLLAMLQSSAPAQIAIGIQVPADTWPILADPHALEVALINLAVNARDAIPGQGRIDLSSANVSLHEGRDEGTELDGDFVAVSMSDNGVGIPEQHLAHVFEPFYTTKPVGRGTGLGLSQVYGFAKQSGGAVTIRSRPGEGTTVTLYLPRGHERPAAAAPRKEGRAIKAIGRVLLVEDNAEVAEVMAAMLEALGYGVTRAPNAAAALRRLQAGEAFDVLLSDIVMPDGPSGLELAERARQLRPDLPLLLMTGYSEALANGAAHGFPVLAKPFGQEAMAAAIRSVCDDRSTAPEPARAGLPE